MTKRVEKSKKMVEKIEKEKRIERNIKKCKKILKISIMLFIFFCFLFYYMRFIETRMLFVKEEKVESTNIPSSLSGLKVIHFSNLHYLVTIDKVYLEKLVNKINLTKPDIVIFTGNLLDSNINYKEKDYEDLKNALSKIKCNISKYFIEEDDNKLETENNIILTSANFINLTNKKDVITSESLETIELFGLDKNDLVEEINLNTYSIAIFNDKETIEKLKNYNFDLAFTNSNQNQIFSNENKNKTKTNLVVNNGIGSNYNMKLRFLNPPSITLVRLVHKN